MDLKQTNGFHITFAFVRKKHYSFSSSLSSSFGFEIGWSWRSRSPDMNDELTTLLWDCGRTRFDRRCCRTGSGRERESGAALTWMDGRGGRSGMEFGCTKLGLRVLRVGSIMNHPVEISDINTNSFLIVNWELKSSLTKYPTTNQIDVTYQWGTKR